MREVIATMSVEEIKGDRLNFVKGVNDSVELELRKIGLTLINVNITDIQGIVLLILLPFHLF
jgi:flotillin